MGTEYAVSAGLSALIAAAYHGPLLRKGFNESDEGYLWFGILKVLDGKVPIRDFRAYDPGRYFFGALWAKIFGRGLLALRTLCLLAQTVSLFAVILAIHLMTGSFLYGFFAGLAAVPWLYPRYKQMDTAHLSMAILLSVVFWKEPRTPEAILGAFVGYSFFLGLNHGLYCGAAFVLQMILGLILGRFESGMESAAAFFAGGLVGFLPAAAMLLFIPGYARAYWERKILRVLRRKTSNLTKPRPWIWRSGPFRENPFKRVRDVLVRMIFTSMIPVYSGFIIAGALTEHRGFIGVGCLGLTYFHHTQSRADIYHDAPSMIPYSMGILAAAAGIGSQFLSVILTGFLSLGIMVFGALRTREWTGTPVQQLGYPTAKLRVPSEIKEHLDVISGILERYSRTDDPIVAIPNLVTLYPLFRRDSAVYDVFCVYPATEDEENRMISEIEASSPPLALIYDFPQDQRDDLRFSATHPAVWKYLNSSMVETGIPGTLPEDYHLFLNASLGEDKNGG